MPRRLHRVLSWNKEKRWAMHKVGVPTLRIHLILLAGDVTRGLQVVESACAITSNLLGEKLEVSKDMDTETRRLPLGVCAR